MRTYRTSVQLDGREIQAEITEANSLEEALAYGRWNALVHFGEEAQCRLSIHADDVTDFDPDA